MRIDSKVMIFLMKKGFQLRTLKLLNDENINKLAADYGWGELNKN